MTGPDVQQALERSPDFLRLKQRIVESTGLHYYSDRDEALAEQIRRLSVAHRLDASAYCRWVLGAEGGDAIAELTAELVIGETYFFRYPQQLAALRDTIIPDCIDRRRGDRRLRVWSAGCASGAEPYTLSILLKTDFAVQLAGWQASILGTDINRRALDQARSGLYSNWELRTADDDLKRQYFVPVGNRWSLRPPYRSGVELAEQNLAAELDGFTRQWAGAFDLILCRNVMIYFAPELIRRLIRCLNACLAPGGWLMVGHAEPYFEIANVMTPVMVGGTTAYRRADQPVPRSGAIAALAAAPAEAPAGGPGRRALDLAFAPAPRPAPPPLPGPPPTPSGATDEGALAQVRRLADTGEWAAALAACEQLVARFPLSADGHYAHALVAEHAGAAAQAEPALKRAIYLDRGFALAHYHLGRCQLQRGARTAAARSFANALAAVAAADDEDALAMGDGLTVGDLHALVAIHADMLGQPQP